MSTADFIHQCASCGAEESLDVLIVRMIDDDQVRRLIADVLTSSLELGGLVVRYLRLHKPTKQKLRMSVVAKVLAELVPDIQRNAIDRNGRTWLVNTALWTAALQAVFDAHQKGTVKAPLQGNGYLYQVLMRQADRGEAAQENEVEADRRAVRRQGPAFSGSALDAVDAAPPAATVPGTALGRAVAQLIAPPAEPVSKEQVIANKVRLADLRNEIAGKAAPR